MATILGDVQYSQVMGHLPTPGYADDIDDIDDIFLILIKSSQWLHISYMPSLGNHLRIYVLSSSWPFKQIQVCARAMTTSETPISSETKSTGCHKI